MASQLPDTSRRRAFYPCCGADLHEPPVLLTGMVDEIIFCDIAPQRKRFPPPSSSNSPELTYVQEDVRKLIIRLPEIRILFYRGDSTEGGSGIYILGREWLGQILSRFPADRGLIITDGSNNRDHIFSKMIRPGGYYRRSWNRDFLLKKKEEQPWFESHGLYVIETWLRQ